MNITPYKLQILTPPTDDLKAGIRASRLVLRDGDIVAISSKAVSIGEGRTVPIESIAKEDLIVREASWFLKAPPTSRYRRIFTIAGGAMVGSSGVDESNGNGHYILYPEFPMRSAQKLRRWLMRTYGVKKLGVIITDSTSIPLRRGAIGFALAWSGFEPLRDYRGRKDLFDRAFKFEVANVADSLAVAANLALGEGDEQTPLAVIRNAPHIRFTSRSRSSDSLAVAPDDDVFAPLFFGKNWKSNKRV